MGKSLVSFFDLQCIYYMQIFKCGFKINIFSNKQFSSFVKLLIFVAKIYSDRYNN